ncbi:MAG: hypothetical protein HYX67_13315, partial [Candidatus Melainabacteria bacterium]|nr:hypothetical protein [Candidatus Melainabacteria bacterium]
PELELKKVLSFASDAMKTIHTLFFAGNDFLTHKNRLDFIEIFYLFFSLKLIELFRPDSMSFTCKDAIDTGPAASAELFAFMRLMNNPSEWSKEEKNFFLWMLYGPALTSRERAIDPSCFNRMVNAMAIINAEIEAHYSQTVAACAKLFDMPFFKGFKVQEA